MLPPTKRLHYYDHQFLRVDDFTDEQTYHLGMRRAHNRLLHTPGVAQGLSVSLADPIVTVTAGVAVDADGRELVLPLDQEIDLSARPDGTFWITLAYAERPSDPTTETGAAGDRRWQEEPVLAAEDAPPADAGVQLVLGRVLRAGGEVRLDDGEGDVRRRIASARGGELEARTLIVVGESFFRGVAQTEGDLVVGARLGVGIGNPDAPLHVLGGNGNVAATEGDLKIGDNFNRLKLGMATSGAGAGDARVNAFGTNGRLMLGSAGADLVFIQNSTGVGIGRAGAGGAQSLTVQNGIHFGGFAAADRRLVAPQDGTLRWQVPGAAPTHALEVGPPNGTAAVHLDLAGASWLNGGFVAVGHAAPDAPLHVAGGRDFNTTDGDLKVGTGTNRLKVGVVTSGPTAGEARLRAEGTAPRLVLGAGGADVLTVASAGVGIGAAPAAGTLLNVAGAVNATEYRVAGTPLVGSQWAANTGGISFISGNVGIGVASGTYRLNVSGTVNATEYRVAGTLFRASQWSDVTGGIAYSSGNVAVGGSSAFTRLTVNGSIGFPNGATPMMFVYESGTGNVDRPIIVHSPAYPEWGLWYSDSFDTFYFRNAAGATPSLTVEMTGQVGIGILSPTAKLHVGGNAYIDTSLSCNTLTIRSGAKPGYVYDHFVNRAGDPVEQGDVVVIGATDTTEYWATGSNVPIPEVDLATQAYDTRVCGIVDKVVTEDELPFAEARPAAAAEKPRRRRGRKGAAEETAAPAAAVEGEHPLRRYAAADGAAGVGPGQMGNLVTLGAFAHCKVDADIAPIRVGDLLTTSPTRGHAQKVLEPAAAVGAIVGKALGSLEKGKGKIPVLVMLQ